MIEIQKATIVTSEMLAKIISDPRCRIGKGITIEDGASIYLDPEFKSLIIEDGCSIARGAHLEVHRGGGLAIGKNVTLGRDSTISVMLSVTIGDGVGIANSVSIRDHNHRVNNVENLRSGERSPWASGFESAPIVIEAMAVISDAVRILPGVRIGQNTMIGAGVHLRESIGPNCRIVGNAEKVRALDSFCGPLVQTEGQSLNFCFFGDSLTDRPSIVVKNPHYDLPKIGALTEVIGHETAGFYKAVHQRLKVAFPDKVFLFQKFAEGARL